MTLRAHTVNRVEEVICFILLLHSACYLVICREIFVCSCSVSLGFCSLRWDSVHRQVHTVFKVWVMSVLRLVVY